MKILHVITRAELGGGQRHVADLMAGLQDRFEIELAAGEEGYLVDHARQLGVPVHIVPDLVQPIAPLRDLRALHALSRILARAQPDLVHAHTSKAGILGRAAARRCDIPSIFTAHTWCFAEGASWKWKLIGIPCEKLAARWSGAILNVSEANRQLALKHGIAPPGRLFTVHNGIPDVPDRAHPGRPAPEPRIVMVARFAPQKAQADLLRALRGIEHPYRAVFVGEGPTRPVIEALAVELGLRDRVEFLGERRDIAEILACAHIFALPTNWEGFPLSILEAMRAGLPVVASDVGGNSEALDHGKTGYLVEPRDINAFRDRLTRLIADPVLRQILGAAGRARFQQEFTLDAMLQKTVAVYRAVTPTGRWRLRQPRAVESEPAFGARPGR